MKVNFTDRFLLYITTNTSLYFVGSTNDQLKAESIYHESILNGDTFDIHIYDQRYDRWLDKEIDELLAKQLCKLRGY